MFSQLLIKANFNFTKTLIYIFKVKYIKKI